MKQYEAMGRNPLVNKNFKPSPLLISNELLGVEIELENIPEEYKENVKGYWQHHKEGSLRNGGAEYTFHKPWAGETVVDAFKSLNQFFVENKLKPDCSVRTSTHIHVNIDNMTEDQFIKMMALYILFERYIFKAYAAQRESSHYCVPLSQCEELIKILCNFQKSKNWGAFINDIKHYGDNRYSALNLLAVTKFSSVEFRHFGGTIDEETLLTYCNLVLALKKYAMEYDKSLEDMLYEVSIKGKEAFTSAVFPKEIAATLIRNMSYSTNFHKAIRLVQSIIVGPVEDHSMTMPAEVLAIRNEKKKQLAQAARERKKHFLDQLDEQRRLLRGAEGQQQEADWEPPPAEPEAKGVNPHIPTRLPVDVQQLIEDNYPTMNYPGVRYAFWQLHERIMGRFMMIDYNPDEARYWSLVRVELRNRFGINIDIY